MNFSISPPRPVPVLLDPTGEPNTNADLMRTALGVLARAEGIQLRFRRGPQPGVLRINVGQYELILSYDSGNIDLHRQNEEIRLPAIGVYMYSVESVCNLVRRVSVMRNEQVTFGSGFFRLKKVIHDVITSSVSPVTSPTYS